MKTPIIEGLDQYGLVSYLQERQYDPLYWPTFFPLRNVDTLDGKTLIGAIGSRMMAHVVAFDATAPESGRKTMTPSYFDIPKTVIARPKSEKEIIEHNIARKMRGNDAVIEDYFADVDFCFDGCNARMEWFALTALSATKLQLTTSNNPLGIVNETVVDFGMPAANKKTVAVIWSVANKATMTPIEDFKTVVKAARSKGIYFTSALMHPDTFDLITGSTEFQTACKSLLVGESQLLGLVGLDTANKVLTSLRLPKIVLIETSLAVVSKANVSTESNPWESNHVTFIPSTIQGNMYNGPIAEELEKPDGILQTKRSNVLLSIQKRFNPVSVLTKGECNVFPSWPMVDRCFSLYINHASTWA